MRIHLAQPRLETLDDFEPSRDGQRCLVLTTFVDDRPLRGLTGLVDWRLNGQLSRLMLRDFIDGHYQEAMLTPIAGRLPVEQVLLVGMGKRSDFNAQRFEDICRFCFDTLVRLHIVDIAMCLPGRVGLDVGVRNALAGWRRAIAEAFPPEMLSVVEITILETPEVQRELVEPMRLLEREMNQAASSVRIGR